MDYFTKWPVAYAIPNQEASTVADALVTNFFCHSQYYGNYKVTMGRNFEFRLLQEVLQRLGVSKTSTTLLHPQSDGMAERYIRTVEEQTNNKTNSVALVRERTIPTERPPLVGEVSATFADRGCRVVSATNSYGRILDFLDRNRYSFFQVAPHLYS
jgi:hypothetical protein